MKFLKVSLFTSVYFYFILAVILTNLSSCATYKHIPYFEDLPDSINKPVLGKTPAFKNPVIQPDDVLTITIQTIDNDVTNLLNSPGTLNGGTTSSPVLSQSTSSLAGAANAQTVNGYLVDNDGYIEMPFTGKIHVAGLTTSAARDTIHNIAEHLFNNPIVNVRYANYKITVLGEVDHPSTFIAPNEKVSIFDALGMAGDITIFGKKENVVLLRDTLGQKEMVRLNLNSKDIVSSPWFYLQPNDIIYVEPNQYKAASVDAVKNRNITIFASAISILIVLITRINF